MSKMAWTASRTANGTDTTCAKIQTGKLQAQSKRNQLRMAHWEEVLSSSIIISGWLGADRDHILHLTSASSRNPSRPSLVPAYTYTTLTRSLSPQHNTHTYHSTSPFRLLPFALIWRCIAASSPAQFHLISLPAPNIRINQENAAQNSQSFRLPVHRSTRPALREGARQNRVPRVETQVPSTLQHPLYRRSQARKLATRRASATFFPPAFTADALIEPTHNQPDDCNRREE